MNGEVLLSAAGLTRDFSGRRVINDIGLALSAGDVMGLLGPNGAGKSTTLKMLSGVLEPSAGTISVRGVDLQQHPHRAKRHIGYLPEDSPVYPDLTVNEFLAYCASLKLIDRAAQATAIEQAKQRCGLGEVGPRLIGNLSKGYRQRIGIAQAIIHHPSVLILDEPTNGLDPIQIRDVRKLVRELAAASQALIISTHLLSEVQMLCNKVAIIDHGELRYSGKLDTSSSDLVVELSPAPPLSFYEQLEGVSEITQINDSRVQLRCNQRTLVSRGLVDFCSHNGVDLIELSSANSELEQLFFDLTCSDGNLPDD